LEWFLEVGDTSGFHGDEYEEGCLLIALIMVIVSSFETSVNIYEATRCSISEDQ
jgi:hypothetical protein